MDHTTSDQIIARIRSWVDEKKIVSPSEYLTAATYLNATLGDEQDELYKMQSAIANAKVALMDGRSMAEVNLRTQATPEYLAMKQQEGKVKRIEEYIRLAKRYAQMKETIYLNS